MRSQLSLKKGLRGILATVVTQTPRPIPPTEETTTLYRRLDTSLTETKVLRLNSQLK